MVQARLRSRQHRSAVQARRYLYLAISVARHWRLGTSPLRCYRFLLLSLVLIAVGGHGAAARSRTHPLRVQVRFLATSTLYRTTWGMNEDNYLADLMSPKNSQPLLARLVDEYSNWAPPIPATILRSESGTLFKLMRDPLCDIPYAKMPLRTAPGDMMALLRETLDYRPNLAKMPDPNATLPCYRTVRGKK